MIFQWTAFWWSEQLESNKLLHESLIKLMKCVWIVKYTGISLSSVCPSVCRHNLFGEHDCVLIFLKIHSHHYYDMQIMCACTQGTMFYQIFSVTTLFIVLAFSPFPRTPPPVLFEFFSKLFSDTSLQGSMGWVSWITSSSVYIWIFFKLYCYHYHM